MNLRASLIIGLRYLSPRGSVRRIRGAVLAVALSLIPLVVVLEISEGMIQGITARFLELGTYHLQALSFDEKDSRSAESLLARIEAQPGVTLVVSERQGLGLAYSPRGRTGATIRAVPEDLWERDPGLRSYLEVRAGRFDITGPDSAVIGTELASRLHVDVGDEIKILTVRGYGSEGFIPRVSTFTVRGIVSTGYQEMDKLWIYISYDRGRRILPATASREIIGIKVEDPFGNLNGILESLYRDLPPGFRLYSWYELERAQYMSFTTTRYLLIFIMVLIVLVASVNISSSLVMLQIEKREEIAILKSCGMEPAGITSIFILIGFAVGIIGTFLGIAAGLAIAVSINEILAFLEISINTAAGLLRILLSAALPDQLNSEHIRIFNPRFYLERIPIVLRPIEIVGAACFSLSVALLAAFLPARNAGRSRPLDVLRKH